MTDKELEKRFDELMKAVTQIKKILDEMYPYKTKEELIKVAKRKHNDDKGIE
jgi:hypothetical protein